MATGIIKRIVKERGFGFILPEGSSEELFFHKTAVEGGSFDELAEGGTVEFEAAPDPKKPERTQATKVRPAS